MGICFYAHDIPFAIQLFILGLDAEQKQTRKDRQQQQQQQKRNFFKKHLALSLTLI